MARPTATAKKSNVAKELINATPTLLSKENGKKYSVNVRFDGSLEADIRSAAARNGMGVATYIKWCVMQQLNK